MNEEMDQIRRMVIRRISETSLRRVAGEVRMSPSGLSKFATGAEPYQKTVAKLRAWRARHAGVDHSSVDADDANSALELLTHGLDPNTKAEVVIEAIDLFGRAYGDVPPPWLASVRERWEPSLRSAEEPR